MIPLTGFLLLTSYISADVKLGWEKDEAFVNEGKDLKITCILPVTSEFRAIESSSRLLYLVDSPGVNSKRYSKTKVTPSNGRTIIEFFIPKVRGSDSGDYHCRCESKVCNGVVYKFKLNILVLPRKVEFRSIAPFSQEIISNNYDSVVTLNEVNRRFLSCFIVVKGSKIKPKILITRDKEVSGEKNRDVSSDFQESTKTSEESALDFNMTYTLRSNSYADYNNAKLTCAAEIPKLKPVSTRVTVEVKYPPKLNCDALEYRRKVGDKFKIVCKVRANPKADVSLILPKGGNAQDSPDFGLQVHQEVLTIYY